LPKTRRKPVPDDLSRGTWGFNAAKTLWVPPQFAGVSVNVEFLSEFQPNPCQVPLILDEEPRHKHACAPRRGGKTAAMGAAAPLQAHRRALALIAGEDPHPDWGPGAFDAWFAANVGKPGEPCALSPKRLLGRTPWPIPCIGGAPEASLCNLQRVELSRHYAPWEDELGAVWLDGGQTLVILGLGIVWRFQSFERARTKVGAGTVLLWVTEAARCKRDVWEHVLPSLADRRGHLYTDTTPWGGRDPDGYWGQCVATSCPEEAELAGKPLDPEARYYHWLPVDNYAIPGLQKEMDRDVARLGPRSAYVLRTWLASWENPEGACWPEFDRSKHICCGNLDEYELFIAGYDHGFSESAACCLVCGVTRALPRKMHVFAALYGTGIYVTPPDPGADFASSNTVAGFLLRELKKIRAKHPGVPIRGYGAPERTESWSALNRQKGMAWDKADHVSGPGIEAVGHAFAAGRLTIEPGLPSEVVRDIEGARWAKDSQGRPLPVFDKQALDPHAGEALVYAVGAVSHMLDLTAPVLAHARVF